MGDMIQRVGQALVKPIRRGLGIASLEHQIFSMRQQLDHHVARFDSIDGRLLIINRDVLAYREGAEEARDAMVAAAGQFGVEVARLEEVRNGQVPERLKRESRGRDQPAATLLSPGNDGVCDASAPFVLARFGALPPGSHILDTRGVIDAIPAALVSFGLDVSVVSTPGYPSTHPSLHELHSLPVPSAEVALFDGAIVQTSYRGISVGSPGQADLGDDAALSIVDRLRGLVRPGGRIVLVIAPGDETAATGPGTPSEMDLSRWVAGWDEVAVSLLVRREGSIWMPRVPGEDEPFGATWFALLTATAPA